MMELANRISLVPGDAVSEVAVKDRKPFLRQDPCVADIYLHNKHYLL